MKIGVVGCGAVGSYYGARLARAGEEVHFLLRSDYEVVRRRGVEIRSPQGDFHVHPRCARVPAEIGICDVVLIALKATANARYGDLVSHLVGPQTAVVTLQNGLGNEEMLAKIFPVEQILGGLCFVCLNRVEPGIIQHLDHGMVVLGEFQRYPEPRTHDIALRIRNSGVPCSVTDNLARAHWEKLVWNIPFNGLGVAGSVGREQFQREPGGSKVQTGRCLTTKDLLVDPFWEGEVRGLMLEVIHAAARLGHAIPDALAEKQISRTRTMGEYRASTLIDFDRGLPLELASLFLEPLRQAQAAGAPVNRLKHLSAWLEELNPAERNL